ncbi:hypothetical protein AAZX31_14G096200 [Glycine max]
MAIISDSFPFTAQLLPYTSLSLSLIPLLPFPLVVCSHLKEDSCPSPRFFVIEFLCLPLVTFVFCDASEVPRFFYLMTLCHFPF